MQHGEEEYCLKPLHVAALLQQTCQRCQKPPAVTRMLTEVCPPPDVSSCGAALPCNWVMCAACSLAAWLCSVQLD
jgi:hypothetical protein